MATDFSTKPRPPVLKRFANLDIDGVEKPARRAPVPAVMQPVRASARDTAPVRNDGDLRDLEVLAEDLNDNARAMRDDTRANRRVMPGPGGPAATVRSERADELRRRRPPDPPYPMSRQAAAEGSASRQRQAYAARAAMVNEIGVNGRLWELPRAPSMTRDEIDMLEGMTPGVMTMEVDLRRRGRQQPAPREQMTPLELTQMAARQIQLMAWEAGVPGSGLRILTSSVGGLGRPEIDFAFDDNPEPDDLVFECHGVTIMIDPGSLRWVAGRRITWHDVPGSEGFNLG